MRQCVLGVAIAVLIAGSVVFGQGQGRAVQERATLAFPDYFVGSCDGFNVLADVLIDLHVTTVYDTETNLPKTGHESSKLLRNVLYNSVTSKSVDGGPGVSSRTLDRYDDAGNIVLYEGSALGFKVMVPGHGWIFMETGHVRLDPATGAVLFDTGHSSYLDQDLAALCEFLR